jgi:putative hydrolase of HD superfamily
MTESLDDALAQRLDFLLDADALKTVVRRNAIRDGSRRENSAEHSWHLALMALVLAPYSDEQVEIHDVIAMLLVHDLVEIDADDTFAYDDDARETKPRREEAAASRLYDRLPDIDRDRVRRLWDDYERNDTPAARFAHAIDHLQPLLLNYANQGALWREHGIVASRVRTRNETIANASVALWDVAQALIDDAVEMGWLAE